MWRTLLAVLWLMPPAQAASCRGYEVAARAALAAPVARARRVEQEMSDRLAGLDTRPFAFLRAEVEAAVATLADPVAFAEEDALRTCTPAIEPLRAVCAGAAALLAVRVARQNAGAPEDRKAYAEAMGHCERMMRLPPLTSSLRAP
jgi:hypothetical protein